VDLIVVGSRAIFLSHEARTRTCDDAKKASEEKCQDCGCLKASVLDSYAVSDADDRNNTLRIVYRDSTKQHKATMLFQSLLSALLVFISPVSAQFQFFEQMFNQGGQQQQQQPQNAGSDSAWYQQRYEDGMNSQLQNNKCSYYSV
jgi:hypothetical protein